MLNIYHVRMDYPIPKRYIDYIKKPFTVRKHNALRNVSLIINEGDRVAFLGANGAGKTTLLKLIGGILYPSAGHIHVDGFDTIKNNLKARKNVAFVLNEERSFYWRLTGRQNLEFFGALDNMKGNDLKRRINELLRLVDMEDSAERLVAGYSSGMKQRLAIARGLIGDPNVLILDEPTRTLDPIATREIKEIIKERINKNKERTLLIATHRFEEAVELCNKVCIMKKGAMVYFDTIEKAIKDFDKLENCYQNFVLETTEDINIQVI